MQNVIIRGIAYEGHKMDDQGQTKLTCRREGTVPMFFNTDIPSGVWAKAVPMNETELGKHTPSRLNAGRPEKKVICVLEEYKPENCADEIKLHMSMLLNRTDQWQKGMNKNLRSTKGLFNALNETQEFALYSFLMGLYVNGLYVVDAAAPNGLKKNNKADFDTGVEFIQTMAAGFQLLGPDNFNKLSLKEQKRYTFMKREILQCTFWNGNINHLFGRYDKQNASKGMINRTDLAKNPTGRVCELQKNKFTRLLSAFDQFKMQTAKDIIGIVTQGATAGNQGVVLLKI